MYINSQCSLSGLAGPVLAETQRICGSFGVCKLYTLLPQINKASWATIKMTVILLRSLFDQLKLGTLVIAILGLVCVLLSVGA